MRQRLITHTGLFILSFLLLQPIQAQVAPVANAAEIKLQLNRLNVLGSVLYIAAHPDDENTRLISYLSKEKLYRTGYLSLTRGDGGQNLIGNELGPLLGLIRTQELLAARKVDGGEQFFTRANDFGYTKSPEETFTFWNKDSLLADVVYVIRSFQPDVIICRFPSTGEGGHGQHTASAILAEEAFAAAADPNRFPDQLKTVSAWQAKRLLWNTFSFGSNNTTSEDQFKTDVGVFNELLGRGYSEIAADSRSMHKSQGFGAGKNRGVQWEYFKTIKGEAPVNSLTDGVNITWSRVPGGASIQQQIEQLIAEYAMENPSASVAGLVKLHTALQQLPDSYWKTQKLKETEQLICVCAGLWMEVYSTKTTVSPGTMLEWKLQAINRGTVPVVLKSVQILSFDSLLNLPLRNNELMTLQRKTKLNLDIPITQPYWLLLPYSQFEYKLPSRQLVTIPENTPPVIAVYTLEIDGRDFTFKRPVVYKSVDPVRGEVYRHLEIAPEITATIMEPTYIFTTAQVRNIKVNLKSGIDGANGTVTLKVPEGWLVTPLGIPFELKNKGDEMTVTFSLSPTTRPIHPSVDTISASVEMIGKQFHRGLLSINYDHIPAITQYPLSTARLVSLPLITSGKNIGYVKGAGDLIPEMLQQVGYTVTMLSDEEMAGGNLSQYDAIITGVRAYNTNDRLKYLNEKLLEYVKQGGIMLVQYNTSGNDLVMNNFGPYPFKISRERVTDEQAAVTFLKPDAAILQTPNKITAKDFEGWIQERGLYFLTDIDSNYQKLFAMNDKGEKPMDGSLVVCNYGKGRYVYTGLSFFRELPAGVPGAFRLFVNLISK